MAVVEQTFVSHALWRLLRMAQKMKTPPPTYDPQDSISLDIHGGEFKVYSERALQRKIRDEQRRLRPQSDIGLAPEAIEYLILARLREMMAVPGLSRLERRAALLDGTGFAPRDAARFLGVRIGRYRRLLASAKYKVERYGSDPYAGWYEVYLAEVNRYIYRGRPT